jgi:hypothetical protein
MNKKWLPHAISAGALAVFIVLGLACASNKWANVTYSGEETPLLANTTWDLTFLNGTRNCTVVFQPGGKLSVSNFLIEVDGTWQRTGNNIQFVFTDAFGSYAYAFEGTDDQDRQITGSHEDSKGKKWEFIMLLLLQP